MKLTVNRPPEPPEPPKPPPTYTLELTQYEAQVLRELCGSVSGSKNTARDTADELFEALGKAGATTLEEYFTGTIHARVLCA